MKSKEAEKSDLICIAEIVGVHGIKGQLKLKVFSESPEDIEEYLPLCSSDGKHEFDFKNLHPHKNVYLANLDDIKDRTAAEQLRGTKLYISRDRLPDTDNHETFYQIDLIGLKAVSPDGEELGKVIDIKNFGAGDILEIAPVGAKSYYVAFNNNFVPEVNLEKNEIIIDLPTEV